MAGQAHHALALPEFEIPPKVLIVVAPYYVDIAADLVDGAQTELAKVSAKVSLAEVPGALEVPTAIGIAFRQADYDGFIALGCVIRGETTHYETVCDNSNRALQLLGVEGACIGNGILTVESHEQAAVRADPGNENKGGGAAAAALHLIALKRRFGSSKSESGSVQVSGSA
ncbi:MAG: 6,7-dimethyl-8-ribityllumazine synthase [Boseongicola sp. SB0676_bin_33]|nr:6,7-dimethyl-8-ribityllumazine synthase [Boseongicola sp. SB0676_bin_33]MYK33195.1 6,7-dimethyl-8-ribityllumazine synthase [Boseongicola sp. SB0670_bin_30]